MKHVTILTARDRASLAAAARTLSRITSELLDAPSPNSTRTGSRTRSKKAAAATKPKRRPSLRDAEADA